MTTYDILIAEDEPFLAQLCEKTLRKPGMETRIAYDGRQAIAEIQKRTPDVLILDLLLPIIDGFSVIEFLQTHPHRFPVIVLSNLGDDANAQVRERFPVAAYCVKSETSLAELERIVDECVRESLNRQEAAL